MKLISKLKRLNKKIDNCDIYDLKELSNKKTKLIYAIYDEIMIKTQFPLKPKEKLEALKNKVAQISTILSEKSYLDANHLKNLVRMKSEIELEIFKLNPNEGI